MSTKRGIARANPAPGDTSALVGVFFRASFLQFEAQGCTVTSFRHMHGTADDPRTLWEVGLASVEPGARVLIVFETRVAGGESFETFTGEMRPRKGYRVDSSPEAVARVRERFGMAARPFAELGLWMDDGHEWQEIIHGAHDGNHDVGYWCARCGTFSSGGYEPKKGDSEEHMRVPRGSASCTADPNRLHDTDAGFREVDARMHALWTAAVGASGYDKRKWQALEQGIFDLARRGLDFGT